MNATWARYVETCKAKHPKFKVLAKEDSRLMLFIFRVLLMRFWIPDFMTDVTTTWFSTVYMPRKWMETMTGYRILRHEEKHIDDSRRFPVLFQLSYLGPIPIGPLNARWYWEYRGYVVTLQAHWDTRKQIPDELIDWMVDDVFAGPMYLFMFPFKSVMRRWLEAERGRIISESK